MARRAWLFVFLLVAITMALATTVSAEVPLRKIVVFRSGVEDAARHAAVRSAGGNPLKQLGIVNATAAELTPASAASLAKRSDVLRVENDSLFREDGADVKSRAAQETVPWGVNRIDAPKAWKASSGEGIKVAVLDTGIDPLIVA